MGQFAVGDVVMGFFPFSNVVLTGNAKKRPCVVLAHEEHGDIVIAQITSKAYQSKRAIKIDRDDFTYGRLPVVSYIRPDKLFTTDPVLIERKVGGLNTVAINRALKAVRELFSQP